MEYSRSNFNLSIDDDDIELVKMLKLEIVVTGEFEAMVATLLEDASVSGYTLIRNVSGQGHEHFHEAISGFNEQAGLVMFITVGPPKEILNLVKGLKTLFKKNSGVMFISETFVTRSNYFANKNES